MQDRRCFVYSYDFSFDKEKLFKYLEKEYNKVNKFEDVYQVESNDSYIFCFFYGVVISWGLTENQEKKLLQILEKKCNGGKLGAIDDDLYTYTYGTKSKIEEDNIVLPNKNILSKLACSYALAQSVKLGGFENAILEIIKRTKHLPENLSSQGKINLSRKETRKLVGRIFIERASINLHLELLDIPNFFWENTELEPLYEMFRKYLDQADRVEILNKRLQVLHELLEMLTAELNNQHSATLEWIIIILIAAEISIMVIKEIFHF